MACYPHSSRLSGFYAVILVLCFLSGVLFIGCAKEEQAAPRQAPVVEFVPAAQKDVPIHSEWIGTVDGMNNATIRAQVQGYLIHKNYDEGDVVKKGHVLFEIDPRPFEAALNQAKGNLAQQEARYQNAAATLARVRPLAEKKALSMKDLDDAIGSEQTAKASVFSAKAALDKAKLDLEFTKITSPITGIAGLAKAQIGNLVGPGSTEELTTVSELDQVKVYIQISEVEYLKAHDPQRGSAPDVPLELILADGRTYPYKGKLALADRQVDVKTGTLKVGGIFPNPDHLLRPGQYARVRALIKIKKDAVVVPQRAVSEIQGTYQIAVVGPDDKVDIRPIKAMERIGSEWIIDTGLKPGEKVIVEGIQKVRQGMSVKSKPFNPTAAAQPEAKPEGGKK